MSTGGLTPGDPLGNDPPRPAPERPGPDDSLWSGGAPGYTSPAPPGAGGAAPVFASEPGLPGRPVLSGWWRRAFAQIIDGVIVGGVAVLLVLLLISLGVSVGGEGGIWDDGSGVVAFVLFALLCVLAYAVVAIFYAPLMMARTNGRTVGRQLTGIRVIRAGGEPMTLGVAMVREVLVKVVLVGIISSLTFGLVWLLDYLWPLWDEENRALHDFVVNTRTIRD
jgi:uncharacterized RDD family membrane protein YckC